MPVFAGAEPFVHDGSPEVGVLLCHGFTSTPATMRRGANTWPGRFHRALPRLPGHGTSWQECSQPVAGLVRLPARQFAGLARRCSRCSCSACRWGHPRLRLARTSVTPCAAWYW